MKASTHIIYLPVQCSCMLYLFLYLHINLLKKFVFTIDFDDYKKKKSSIYNPFFSFPFQGEKGIRERMASCHTFYYTNDKHLVFYIFHMEKCNFIISKMKIGINSVS